MARRNEVNAGREKENGGAEAPRRTGKHPKLGQNFLTDKATAARIVDALGDVAKSTVVEIGPGRGILTDLLVARAGRVIAIEVDRVLAAQLRMRYAARENIEIIEGDILTIDLDTVLGPRPGGFAGVAPVRAQKVRVVGNLPYYITSDILLRLFRFHEWFDVLVLMVQREVAERIAAKPGGQEYGLLSATAQLYAHVEKLFVVPPGAFAPAPKVHSAVLRLKMAPQFERLGVSEAEVMDFLKLSFGQKRKTLSNNLKSRYEAKAIAAALARSGVRADARAETLSLEKVAAVMRRLRQNAL